MKSKIPNVVATIDGSHIPIKVPSVNHGDCFNCKHFYSFLLQGVVDYTGLFSSVATGFSGSLQDARMLRLSDFHWTAKDEEILMEPTFDLAATIIHPVLGLTKGRWRVFLKRLDEDHNRIPETIVTCCILHNIYILRNDVLYVGHDDSDDEDDDLDCSVPNETATAGLLSSM